MKLKRNNRIKGKLTVIAGPMFSGKTGKLVAIIDVLSRMGKQVLTVKPSIDKLYSDASQIQSHDNRRSDALLVDGQSPQEIIDTIKNKNIDTVILDEVQFFHKIKTKKLIQMLRKSGIDIIAAGLLYDYRRKPFGITPDLMGLADERLELFAICQKCGGLARHTERTSGSKTLY